MVHTMWRVPEVAAAAQASVVDPNARGVEAWQRWRDGLADALGTDVPLDEVRLASLRGVAEDLAGSDDPRAWAWATVCGAEIVRREAEAAAVRSCQEQEAVA